MSHQAEHCPDVMSDLIKAGKLVKGYQKLKLVKGYQKLRVFDTL